MKEVQSLGDIRFGTLARAAEGLTQWRPLLLAFLTLLLTGVVVWLGQWMAIHVTPIMALVMMLLAFVVMMAGFSGVGIMLMDKAKNQPVRSFAAAASAGLLCLPKFLLIALVMTVAFIAYMIVAAIIYFVCKIPFVGGIVAFIAHPVLVLSFAAVLVALIWVVGPLMAPALWSGLPVKAAIANVLAIARKRLIEVVLMEVLLYIILSLIGVLLFAGLVPASLSLTGLGISIMGDSNAMMAMAMSGMGRYGGGMSPMAMMGAGGNTWGLMAGLGVLYCVIGALLTQVAIMGMNLIYLQARENLNPAEAEGALDDLMGDMRKKATEAKDRARQAAQDLTAKKDSGDAAPAASAPTSYQPPQDHGQPSYGVAAAGTAAAAGLAAGNVNAASPSADQAAHSEALTREQALAAEKARMAAEEEAARQRTEAEVARVRAEAEAARQRADALAAEQAARDRAAAEAEAAAKARAEEQAAAERAAREQAQAQAQIAAEEARRRAEAEAAERAANERAEQERMAHERAEHERAQAAEQAARERAEVQAAAQAAERARQQEQAQAEARQRAEEQAREQARLQAEREAAEREAARAQAQAEAEEKARLAAVKPSCPSCHAHVSADDMFCGECGYKLK